MVYLKKRRVKNRKKKAAIRYLNSKNVFFLYKKKFAKKKKKLAFLLKIYNKNLKKKVSNSLIKKRNFTKKIQISIVQNNVFCTLINLKMNKTLHVGSSGIYRIKLSKRKLKYFLNAVILIFFSKIKKHCKNFNNTIVNVSAPIRIRKKLCKIVKKQIKRFRRSKKNILLNVLPKKCFNGCRAKKKLRKKRRLYRIYKK